MAGCYMKNNHLRTWDEESESKFHVLTSLAEIGYPDDKLAKVLCAYVCVCMYVCMYVCVYIYS